MIEVAQSDSKNNVAAAREVTRVTEGEVATKGTSANLTAAMISADAMAMIQRLVGE
jgi:hypothetical protein